jgi:hypothetical protein
MAYNTGVNDKVNGGVSGGNFLTGSMDFFTVATLVPCFPTNVVTPLNLLYTQQGYSTWQPVTVIDGTGTAQTYATAQAYQDAWTQQYNLNLLTQLFAQNANPVAVSVNFQQVSNPHTMSGLSANIFNNSMNYSYSSVFGSNFTASNSIVYFVKFITEKAGYWKVAGSSSPSEQDNTTGYQLLDALEGVSVYDTVGTVLFPTSVSVPGGVGYDLATPPAQPLSAGISDVAVSTLSSLSGQSVTLYTNQFEVDSASNRNTVAYVASLTNGGSPNVPANDALPTP